MRADDERWLNLSQPPALGDPRRLACRVFAIGPCTNHLRIGTTFDFAEYRVITPVEEVLHDAGDRRQVLGRAEDVAIGLKQILRLRFVCRLQDCLDFVARRRGGRLGHLATAPRFGMIDDKKLGHTHRASPHYAGIQAALGGAPAPLSGFSATSPTRPTWSGPDGEA